MTAKELRDSCKMYVLEEGIVKKQNIREQKYAESIRDRLLDIIKLMVDNEANDVTEAERLYDQRLSRMIREHRQKMNKPLAS